MAYMVREEQKGKAVGIEHIPQLAEKGKAAAEQVPFARQMLQDGTLEFVLVSLLQ